MNPDDRGAFGRSSSRLADRLLPPYLLILFADVVLSMIVSVPLGASLAADVLGAGESAILFGFLTAVLAGIAGGAVGFAVQGLWRSPTHPSLAGELALAVALGLPVLPFSAAAGLLASALASSIGLPLLVSPGVAATLTCQAGTTLAILAARRPVVEA